MNHNVPVREPAVAGMFYPDDPSTLRRAAQSMLDAEEAPRINGKIIGIIVPHAAYQYSGPTAAAAYRLLHGIPVDTAVIVAPSHREYFFGISIYPGEAYRTPLGDVMVDGEVRSSIIDNIVGASYSGHGNEHAIEVQLPFLQVIQNNISILPIVMGDQRKELCTHLAQRLAESLRGRSAILIASSDLSHYHSYHEALAIDKVTMDDIQNFEEEKLLIDLETRNAEACGGGPMAVVMQASRLLGATHVEILDQCNSGDVTGDPSKGVVGYVSAVIYRKN